MLKIQHWPCALHPEAPAAVWDTKRCSECFRAYRKLRYRKGQEVPSVATLHNNARLQASYRGLPFSLTLEEYRQIVTAPCVYSIKSQEGIRIGIDRRDSSLGYTRDNSQPCCDRHNRMKSDILTHEQSLEIVHKYQIECGNTIRKKETVRACLAAPDVITSFKI